MPVARGDKTREQKESPQWEMASPDAETRRRKEAPQRVENKTEKDRGSDSDFSRAVPTDGRSKALSKGATAAKLSTVEDVFT